MTDPAAILADSLEAEPGPVQVTASPLAAALARVQAELPQLGKSETGKVSGVTKDGKPFSYEYKYADLSSISNEILPLLGRNGLAFTCWPTMSGPNLVLRYELMHEAGEVKAGEYPIGGNTAQALGSSITYARRYCLCAVTGIAPDKDDDAAVVDGQAEREREAARAARVAEESAEYTHAANAVQGSWAAVVGDWDQESAEKLFAVWSKGGKLREADARTLRAFAAYIDATARTDAGDVPPAEPDQQAEPNPTDPPMSGRQRGMLFKLMGEIGLDDKAEQLRWINKQLGTEYESRTKITAANAKFLIDALQQGIAAPDSEAAT